MAGEFNDGGLARDRKDGGVGGGGEGVGAGDKPTCAHRPTPFLCDPDAQKRRALHVFDPDRRPHVPVVNRKQEIDAVEACKKPREAVHRVEEGCVQVAGAGHLDIPGDEESVIVRAGAIGVQIGHGGSFPGT